jgi:thiamine biosynthesis lipoprotein
MKCGIAGMVVLMTAAVSLGETEPKAEIIEARHRAMATEFVLLLHGENPGRLQWAADEAFEEVDWLEQQLSIYQISSEVSGINARAATENVKVEPGLFRLIQFSKQVWQETSGAFDITVGPLVRTWGFFRGRGSLPKEDSIAQVMPRVGMNHVVLDAEQRTVRFDVPGVEIDLGGIGKGYTVDAIVQILKRNGVTSAFVNGGGSTFYALGTPPGLDGWKVGICDPFDKDKHVEILSLRDRSLSTSGNYEKFFEVDGRVYCHILDPRTGHPVEGVFSATALAPTATESDALSTAFFVLGADGTEAYCRSHEGVSAVLVLAEEGAQRFRVRSISSQGTEIIRHR